MELRIKWCILATLFWDIVSSVSITNLYVPRTAQFEAPIDCKYDLSGDSLYDVKWYKDDKQFFRCMADGTIKTFPVEGVNIEHGSHSTIGSCPVTLTDLTSDSGGVYKCEVSLESPTFNVVSKSSTLKVISYSKRTQPKDDIKTDTIRRNETSSQNSATGLFSLGAFKTSILFYLVLYVAVIYRF